MRPYPVLPRLFTLGVAVLWVIIGFDSARVPFFPYWIWPVTFTAIAAGIIHTTFSPDRYKLRLITALSAGSGLTRGVALAIDQSRPGPAAIWLLISMLAIAYYLARRDWLPERHDESS